LPKHQLLGAESAAIVPAARRSSIDCDALFVYVLRSFLLNVPPDETSWLRVVERRSRPYCD
jgi:hypothetical protein